MPDLLQHRYRLVFLMGTRHIHWLDYRTGKPFSFPAGVDLTIQVGIANTLKPLAFYDASNLASAHLVIKQFRKPAPAPEDPTLGDPIPGVVGSPILTLGEWVDDTAQQLTFSLSSTQSNLRAGKYWLGLWCITTAGEMLSIGWGCVDVAEDGMGPTAPVQPLPASYYKAHEVDALLAAVSAGQAVNGLPAGGQPGEVLVKDSLADFDAGWQPLEISWATNDW